MIGIFQARGVIVISKAFSPHDVVRLCHIALKFVLVPDAKEFIIMIDNRELSTGCVFNVKAEAEKYVSMNGYSLLSRYSRTMLLLYERFYVFLPYGVIF